LARNRYGWQKRAKELARKQKHDEKMKRRQGKTRTESAEAEMNGPAETDPVGKNLPADPALSD
jgi:hypothetical protein